MVASSVGLSSGIDYNSILTQLREASSQPIYLAQQQQYKIQQQQSALQSINKLLLDFKSKSEALQTKDNFLSMTVASSDYNIVSPAVKNTATPGSYSVRVKQLAQASRIASQGVATSDSTSISSGGTFAYKIGDGSTTSISVTAGMTLTELRDAINATESKVRASIVNDGTASNPYRLVLTSSETGSANALEIVTNDTTLDLENTTIEAATAAKTNHFDGTVTTSGSYTGKTTKNIVVEMTSAGGIGTAKFKVSYDGGLTWSANDAFTTSATAMDVSGNGEGIELAFGAGTQEFAVGDQFSFDAFAPQLQTAQDAVIEVDGVQISRSTNTFSDVIEGVTLTAKKVDSAAQTITVGSDNSGVAGKVQDMITAYNALMEGIKQQTSFDTEEKTAAPLFGDSGMRTLSEALRRQMTSVFSGIGDYNSLSSVGIKMGSDGKLAFDSTKFNDALKKDLQGVANLFVQSGISTNSSVSFVKSTSDTRTGAHEIIVTAVAEQANVTAANSLGAAGLTQAETLTITTKDSAISVTLEAGSTIGAVIDQLNRQFADRGIAASASKDDDGKLKISSTEYGSEATISVFSNRGAGEAGQLGIGTTVLSDTGVDVAGTIDGVVAKGSGRTLKAESGSGKGLELEVSLLAPTTTRMTLTNGIAYGLLDQIESLTDSTNGIFASREKGFTDRLSYYDKRIETLTERLDAEQERMRAQFNALETKLATMNSQGNYLLSQLSSLIGT